ncbi:hypothetical protein AAVH_34179, partial [Aphelenchoides avenae]
MLPNELLLQVLHFSDYRTLVLAELAGRRFLRLATECAAKLACRLSYRIAFDITAIHFIDVSLGELQCMCRYERGGLSSLAAACRELDGVIGPHAIAKLTFHGNTWNIPGIDVIFEAAPPL